MTYPSEVRESRPSKGDVEWMVRRVANTNRRVRVQYRMEADPPFGCRGWVHKGVVSGFDVARFGGWNMGSPPRFRVEVRFADGRSETGGDLERFASGFYGMLASRPGSFLRFDWCDDGGSRWR